MLVTDQSVGASAGGRDVEAVITEKLTWAERYLTRGWKLFILDRSKVPYRNCRPCNEADWTHDRESCQCLTCHGFYAATADIERIQRMLRLHPDGVLTLRCGQASGVIAIDAEDDADEEGMPTGLDVLDQWESWTGGTFSLPPTLTARSASGGLHLIYAIPEGARIKSMGRVLPSVDIKAEGGYVLLPTPGTTRSWLLDNGRPRVPTQATAELLDWLIRAKGTGKRRGTADGERGRGEQERPVGYDFEVAVKDGARSGERDVFFNDLCFRLRTRGVDQRAAEKEARHHWERCAQPPDAQWFMPWEHVAYKLNRVWQTVAPPEVHAWRGSGGRSGTVRPPQSTQIAELQTAGTGQTEGQTEEARTVTVEVSGGPGVSGTGTDDGPGGGLSVRELGGGDHPEEHDTDTGNGHRFARLLAGEVRHAVDEGKWYVWDGMRLQRDMIGNAAELVKRVIADIRQDALVADVRGDGEARDRWVSWAKRTESMAARKATLAAASTDPRIACTTSALDANPWLFAVKNGVVDLRTGEHRPGTVEDMITRVAGCDYDASADCPMWDAHVRLVTDGDEVLARWLQRACGYTLTGLVKEQKFFFLYGDGDNGKNVFVETLMGLMGDYAQTASEGLLGGGGEQHPTILADLRGARLIMVDETKRQRLNEERIKMLTGSKKVRARWMRGDFFEYDSTMKLWILGNTKPTISDTSKGTWRRMRLVPFTAVIPPERKVLGFEEVLKSEWSGILNWCLAGLADWRHAGLGEAEAVTKAVEAYREEEDVVGLWLADCCEQGVDGRDADGNELMDTVERLYDSYRGWAVRAGVRSQDILDRRWFGRELTRKKIPNTDKLVMVDGRRTRMRVGIRLLGPGLS